MTDAAQRLVAEFAARLERAERAGAIAFGHGAVDARNEAELLVLGHLDGQPWNAETPAALRALLERRIHERVPSAHLTGRAWFAGRWFVVSPGVMIPRSPLQELIVARFVPWLRRAPERILDLCCGCGALGLAAALEFPSAQLTLSDIDPEAVACARRNIERFGLSDRAEARVAPLFEGLDPGPRDLVLVNPPYVPVAEVAELPKEYTHEPRRGLASGNDGLDCWRRILLGLGPWLARDGLLAGEVGHRAAALAEAFPTMPFVWPELARAPRLAHGDFGVFLLDGDCLSSDCLSRPG